MERSPDEFQIVDVSEDYPAMDAVGTVDVDLKYSVACIPKWGENQGKRFMMYHGGKAEWDTQAAAEQAIVAFMLHERERSKKVVSLRPEMDYVYVIVTTEIKVTTVGIVEPFLKVRVEQIARDKAALVEAEATITGHIVSTFLDKNVGRFMTVSDIHLSVTVQYPGEMRPSMASITARLMSGRPIPGVRIEMPEYEGKTITGARKIDNWPPVANQEG